MCRAWIRQSCCAWRTPLAALSRLGAYARARFVGRLVAVTGSVGKTTTKEMLRTILAAQGPTHAAEASYNNHWGVPLTLARLPAAAAFCVCEIGMNHPGEIEPLARLARPHVTLITAIERAHVGHLGSIEAIADEKAADHARARARRARRSAGGVSGSWSGCWAGRVPRRSSPSAPTRMPMRRLLELDQDANGSIIVGSVRGTVVRFRLNAPGRHMAMNAMGALAAAAGLGVDPVAGAGALEGFIPVAGRGVRRSISLPGGDALLLDESYNASAAAVRAALAVLRLQPAARRIAVLGDMLELGEEGPAEHAGLAPGRERRCGRAVRVRPTDARTCSMRSPSPFGARTLPIPHPWLQSSRVPSRPETRYWSKEALAAA